MGSTYETLLDNSPFMKACRLEPTDVTPVWLMRQAGRYMEEYRRVRARVGFMDLCKRPDLAAEVAVTAQERIGADAAILFSDILLIVEPMGFSLSFAEGIGPVIDNPFCGTPDLPRLREVEPGQDMAFALEAISTTRRELPPGIPLIGFAGGPFTVACYLIEGGKSKDFGRVRRLIAEDEKGMKGLMQRLAAATASYLKEQVDAGAQAVQVFDTHVGCLDADEYRAHVLPFMKEVFRSIPQGVPAIHFGTRSAHLLPLMLEAGGTVIGIDHSLRLDQALRGLGSVAFQGNLDPASLLKPTDELIKDAHDVLAQAAGRPGHIFNLGHGVPPSASVENVRRLIDFVHAGAAA